MNRATTALLFLLALSRSACDSDASGPPQPTAEGGKGKLLARVNGRAIHEADVRCPDIPVNALPPDLAALGPDERCRHFEKENFRLRVTDLLLRHAVSASSIVATDEEIERELNTRFKPPEAELRQVGEAMKRAAEAAVRVRAGEDRERVLASTRVRKEALDEMSTLSDQELRDFIAADQVERFRMKERTRASRAVVMRKLHDRLTARAGGSQARYAEEEAKFWSEMVRSSGAVSVDARFPIPSMKGVLKNHAGQHSVVDDPRRRQ